ncbi:Thiamine-monophosphate kinase [Methylocella tundrae]|uniref:Thiamine-monophosphate kinase n=1 Tax=Methylocella tundrae TaxID=227605 RepID=A0A8B6MAB7_METTU|nr:thiamine-phosphate kinase [Methylocella tundrae]VTZ27414.1 Thiamine-monophosphate kinase [Methylocella tundrae]VTZ51465.1 Thiamine-monophosphate kinase [Methylocella tundrae]
MRCWTASPAVTAPPNSSRALKRLNEAGHLTQLTEDELIAAYFAPLAGDAGLRLSDDAALLRAPLGRELVLTKDMLVARVHFFSNDPPAAIARKALRVNLSDLAAKGAEPLGFLLGLALPEDWTTDWLGAFAKGLGEDAARFQCPLLGGDTVKTPGPLTISITAIGAVVPGKMVLRGAAEPGDLIYVTGTIGDAALGLKLRLGATCDQDWIGALNEADAAFLLERFLLPQPRLALKDALASNAHAAMDVSDGLAGDLSKMLRLAGLTAKIPAANIPLSRAAREALRLEPKLIEPVCAGGDDYEILCAVPLAKSAAFEAAAQAAGVMVSAIASAAPGDAPPVFEDREGRKLIFARPSFQHF